MARELMTSVGAAVARRAAPKAPVVAWDPAWSRFAGLYRGRFGDTHIVLLDQRLVAITPNAPTLDNKITLEPLGAGRFRLDARTGGSPIGEEVRFVEENGRVVRLYAGDTYSERVDVPE